MKISLKAKMTGCILLLVLLSTIILSFFAVRISKDKFTQSLDAKYDADTYGYVAKIDGYLNEYQTMVRDAESVVLQSDDPINDESVIKSLGRMTDANENIISAYCGFDTTDYIDGTYWEPGEGWVCTQRPWYTDAIDAKAAGKEIAFSDPYVDADSGCMCISV